ncbi:nicolin-1 isoform X3 [Crotalus tigris]|uniref:nicolin-1 isoform X3 n=1 Tax=Crotalus tigris TaxID=88082 RepID=UPI00192F6CB8|nr:nicolin-1 isoform X3 [Crotalus tigris]
MEKTGWQSRVCNRAAGSGRVVAFQVVCEATALSGPVFAPFPGRLPLISCPTPPPTLLITRKAARMGTMALELVPCTIKNPVALQVGDMKTEMSRPGVLVIDVSFPHSQTTDMLCDVDQVAAMRFILRQPSPVWLHFAIEELQLFSLCQKNPQKGFPAWLSHPSPQEQPTSLHDGLPDANRVSSELQQMWVLTEMLQASQPVARIGRFDIEDSYDLNLLSYT